MVWSSGYVLEEPSKVQPLTHYAIRGERSTGTHYLDALLSRFTNLAALDVGWKHGFSFREDQPLHDQLLLVGIVRDWRDWVLSMYRKPWHASRAIHELDFKHFIRSPWEGFYLKGHAANGQPAPSIFMQDDRDPITGAAFENLLALRNQKHRFLLGLPNRHSCVVLIKYEWLVGHEAVFLDMLQMKLGVATRPFQPINHRFAQQYRSFSTSPRKAPQQISPDDHRFILSQLDNKIETELGYL